MSSDWENDEQITSSISSVDSENETINYNEDIEELLTHNLEPYMFDPE